VENKTETWIAQVLDCKDKGFQPEFRTSVKGLTIKKRILNTFTSFLACSKPRTFKGRFTSGESCGGGSPRMDCNIHGLNKLWQFGCSTLRLDQARSKMWSTHQVLGQHMGALPCGRSQKDVSRQPFLNHPHHVRNKYSWDLSNLGNGEKYHKLSHHF